MKDYISKANQWAMDVWTRAVPNWEDRSQDHNYRDILARTGIYSALASLGQISNGQFLDIGCGEGAETFYIRDSLAKLGWSGKMFGYDPQSHFIAVAQGANKSQSSIPIQFGNGSIDDFLKKYYLSKNVDLLTSIFVLQDLPDIHQYLANVDKALNETGTGIFLLVHPNFGEAMKNKDAVKLEDALNILDIDVPWSWVGEYPIVEEEGRTFFVPYFQRTIDEYKNYFSKYFSQIEFVPLKPSPQEVGQSEKEHRSPFYNHSGNFYYPEIIEMESSLIIIARR
ncbi:class I SAM-dependent methyltransferase [Candidatus Peregrinibacteria bacterium]|nr:class I SAM-dependent methyltransferase [Candidatus Peregrinibacteria bacterium]